MIKVTVSRIPVGDDSFDVDQLVLTFFEDGIDSGALKLGPEGSEHVTAALRAAGIIVHDLRETTEDHDETETDV